MASKRSSSNPKSTDREPTGATQDIDLDDASIDETAVVDPDEDLVELSNPDGDTADRDDTARKQDPARTDDPSRSGGPARPKGAWRGRDADRRANGEDDLKA